MKFLARASGWLLIALCALALTLILRSTGFLAPFEYRVSDARARLLQHEVESDIVIVGMDARSLADLRQWPWPRRYHARVLERLADAKPRRVFVDIDFSARANPEDDAQLETSLARFSAAPVILPIFFQPTTGADSEFSFTKPLDVFARHAQLAGINFRRGTDSLVREATTSWDFAGAIVPSSVTAIAAVDVPPEQDLPIDFSILPSSFGFVSYVDLLAGRVAVEDLRGKTVLVGATALELGDILPLPVYRTQPGVVVQALAAQSLREGLLRKLPEWINVLALAGLAALGAAFFSRRGWRSNVLALGGALPILAAINLYMYASHRLVLELVPALLLLGITFLAATIRSLDQQTLRAIAYALGIKRRDALLGSIVESSTDCIVCIDHSGRIEMANAAGAKLFACDMRQLLGSSLARFVPALDSPLQRQPLAELTGKVSEQQARRLDGSEFPIEISVSAVNVEHESLHTVIVRDISERKAQERKLRHQATHDPLTDLPNRTALTAHLDRAVAQACGDRFTALLMLDLCRFKEVNDTLGHNVGDAVLREVARRFESVTGAGFVARIGGDEFTMVLTGLTGRDAIISLAESLNESLRTPIAAAGIAIDVGVSIGIALAPQDATDAATLLQRADVAMYVAKRRSSPWEFYEPASDQHSVRRLAMVGELRSAIATGQLNLFYQPQINLRTGLSDSVEALLRWRHPEYGAVSPGEFITVAESTDLIRPLTDWTINQALLQAAQWQRSGFEPRIAVNLSARRLQDTEFPALLRSLLEAHRVRPNRFELEITESAMLLDPTRALRVIREIHQLGVIMSIDDFGTGYSSLAYLRDLPVHALKLDQSFVRNMQERAEDRSIVNSTARMAHELRLKVVAEGVETEWAAQYLATAGYDYAQGFLYSRAVAADECHSWMQSYNAGPREPGSAEIISTMPQAATARRLRAL
jgi:diguanylate cyclase (GGDEF)-like protein/PAS domain S-box-containing protein